VIIVPSVLSTVVEDDPSELVMRIVVEPSTLWVVVVVEVITVVVVVDEAGSSAEAGVIKATLKTKQESRRKRGMNFIKLLTLKDTWRR
jgi:hypothetical protein